MKEEHTTNRSGSTLTTILVGGALGAGLALVLAPKSGKEIRKDLRRAADRLSHAVDIGKDLYGESKVFVSKAVDASKKAYTEEKPLKHIQRKRLTPGADPDEQYHRGGHRGWYCAPAGAEIGKRNQGGPEAARIKRTGKGCFHH